MSRDVTVNDIQDAIADIRVWAHGSSRLPEAKADLLLAMADLLESLLVHREELAERT